MASNLKLFLSLVLLLGLLVPAMNSEGKKVGIYELKKGDFSVKVTNFGATVLSVVVPDSKGNLADVALGYEKLGSYVNDTTYFGALVGRVANRIGGARFSFNGKAYRLYPNDGKNSLHGGHRGFNQAIWTVKERADGEFPSITFTYHSFDGEQGFPGNLDVSVTYKIQGDLEYSVAMEAEAVDKATPVNLAMHTYWNLGGHGSGSVLGHTVKIFGSHITPVDDGLIPTGEIVPTDGTPFDFTQAAVVGSRIAEVPGGYDVNYVLNSMEDGAGVRKVAAVEDGRTGRRMELWADKPGVQFYTGNFLNGVAGKDGAVYQKHAGLALETQGFPDSVNHPGFPSQIVNPGEVYRHYMLYKFSNK